MKKLDLAKVKKLKPNPIFKGLSPKLKNPKNFIKIEKQLQDILKSTHKHKTISAYAKCESCEVKRLTRQKKMMEMGFTSINQFLEWRKVMIIMNKKANFQIR